MSDLFLNTTYAAKAWVHHVGRLRVALIEAGGAHVMSTCSFIVSFSYLDGETWPVPPRVMLPWRQVAHISPLLILICQ